MTLLAIDTSESACSVGLLGDDALIDRKSEIIGRGHAERLLPLIEERLLAAGLTYGSLTRIAVTTGPGTYTGLRIGLAVARGLALQGNLPCIGLTGLQVHAAFAAHKLGCDTVYAVIAGRGGQVFMQKFSGIDRMPVAQSEPENLDIEDAIARIKNEPGVMVGTASDATGKFEESGLSTMLLEAIDIATLGLLARDLDPGAYPPEPTYFRAADAKKATPIIPVAPL